MAPRDPLNAAPDDGVLRRTIGNLVAWVTVLVQGPRAGLRRAMRPAAPRLLVYAALSVAVVVLALLTLDGWAVGQQRQLPRAVVEAFEQITDFGKVAYVLLPLGALLILLAARISPALDRMTRALAAALVARVGFLFVAIAIPGLLVTVIKRLIGRSRPLLFDGPGPFGFEPFSWRVEFASLPSGHATTAFAAAAAFAALFPRLRLPLWTLAALVGLSRVFVGAHYPSDVLAGAVCGIFGAVAVKHWFATRRLAFAVDPDGGVIALPGPSAKRLWRLIRRLGGRPNGAARLHVTRDPQRGVP